MNEPDLTLYASVYYRKSDGRKFLGRQVVPGQCRLWDTVDHVFIDMGKNAVASNFRKDKSNKGFANKIKRISRKVSGTRARTAGIRNKPEFYEEEQP